MQYDEKVKSFEYIDWLDHSGYEDTCWKELEENQKLKPFEISSVGWIIKETDKYLILSPHCSFESGKQSGSVCIIKGNITFRKKIPFSYVYPTKKKEPKK